MIKSTNLFILALLLVIACSLNVREISSKMWKNGILQEEQCIMNPVQCPYSGGYSLPQCFTHPLEINKWAICVS